MAQLQRQYDFQDGQKAPAQQMDDELNNLVNGHNVLDADVVNHKAKGVDPTSSDSTRDKHVSNNDLKNLQDQITTKGNEINQLKGSGGASEIGTNPITGISSANVQVTLESLNDKINQTVLGQIPDGSITSTKLAFDPQKITDTVTNAKFKFGIENGKLFIEEVL
ncbi:hypothetical protein [Peribacillus acanthi]|uniref:hypothetical protein n=1 Tax=Peribacillus acanthi TaxID=2171554 RepID=UPI000D3E1419|nr:hypothetical protein [Peribacillus acanthi]